MVGVGDNNFFAVTDGRIIVPSRRWAIGRHWVPTACENLVIVAGRDPICRTVEQRIIDLGLFLNGELHRHSNGMFLVSPLLLILLEKVDHPILPLCRISPVWWFAHPEHFGELLID